METVFWSLFWSLIPTAGLIYILFWLSIENGRSTIGFGLGICALGNMSSLLNSPTKIKKLVLTGAVTAITIAGTLYGAGLKTEQEVKQVSRTPHS